jgi:hypothetical protein
MLERILAIFRAAPGVLADGQQTQLRCDATGALITTGGGGGGGAVTFTPPSSFDTGGTLAASGVIRAAAGTLLDVNGFNDSDDVRFFQLYDRAAVPVDGAVPATVVIRVPAHSNFSISFADGQGRSFSTGITWASSTTLTTKTETGVADMQVNAQFR